MWSPPLQDALDGIKTLNQGPDGVANQRARIRDYRGNGIGEKHFANEGWLADGCTLIMITVYSMILLKCLITPITLVYQLVNLDLQFSPDFHNYS